MYSISGLGLLVFTLLQEVFLQVPVFPSPHEPTFQFDPESEGHLGLLYYETSAKHLFKVVGWKKLESHQQINKAELNIIMVLRRFPLNVQAISAKIKLPKNYL